MDNEKLVGLKRCACANLRATTRAITRYYDEILAPGGLSSTQFSILGSIALYSPIPVTRLSERLLMDQTTLTRNLQLLAKEGLVESIKGEDARNKFVQLTEKGAQRLEVTLPLWEKAQEQITEGLGQERYRYLLKELYEVVTLASDE
jgi:DNA-binding MarR family transcriptional regulator